MSRSYPTFEKLSLAFSPAVQPLLLSDVNKAYSDRGPSIGEISQIYGYEAATLWVKVQILSLDFVSSTKEDADGLAVTEFAKHVVRRYPYIRLTEFMLFIARFKVGQYGRFYGYFDPLTIGDVFRDKFLRERSYEQERAEAARKAELSARREFIPPKGYTSLTWVQELRRRAANGDKEAAELLRPPVG